MNDLLIGTCFGAGVAGFAYSKLGRRVGYGNSQNVWILTGAIFIIASAFFTLLLSNFINTN